MTLMHSVVRGGLVLLPNFMAELRDIVIEGDTIVELVAPGDGPTDARPIDASDRAIIPGLVNGHVHGHATLAKGLVEDRWPLELFLNALPGIGANRTTQDKYLNGLLGAAEMIRKGSTACFDLFFEFPQPSPEGLFAVAQAYHDAGVRAVVAPMVADRTFYQAYPELLASLPDDLRAEALEVRMAAPEASAAAAGEAFRRWPFDRSRVAPGLAPTVPLHCSDAFLQCCDRLARDYALPLQTHLAETKTQAVVGLARYGRSLTAHLAALGLLGPHVSAVHAIWLDANDRRLIAAHGASVIHAPASNLRFGSGMARVRDMLDRGINVGLATDGTNSSDSLNMFEALRLSAGISTMQTPDFDRWLGTAEVLRMATEGSAQAMGFGGRIGRIAPGYKADLVFLSLGHINYVPLGHLARQIVFTENGAAVDSVMIGGTLVLDRGKLTTIDEAKLRREAQAAAERLFAQNAPLRARAAGLKSAVGHFCRNMACQPFPLQRWACEALVPSDPS